MGLEFYEELKALVGKEGVPRVAVDEVCKFKVRREGNANEIR